MKRRGKLRKLKFNIWLYYILYTVIIIATIWIVQIVFLDSFYQKVRYNRLIEAGNNISDMLNSDHVTQTDINRWVEECVRINESGLMCYIVYEKDNELIAETPYSYFLDGNFSGTSASAENAILIRYAINSFEFNSKEYICDYFSNDSASKMQYCIYATNVANDIKNITGAQSFDGYLVLMSSRESVDEAIEVIQLQLIIVTLVVILLSFILAWTIATKLSEPIQRMSNTAKRWAEGENDVVFRGNSYDELNELAEALNYAKEGISKTGLLQRDLLANVSHDLKTPLTMIKAYAEMIRDLSGDIKEKRDMHTQVIIDEADRLTLLVNDILDLSKLQNNAESLVLTKCNLSELVKMVIYRFQTFMESAGYSIIEDIDENLFTVCDEKKMEQVIYNLIGNSINYTGEDKTVTVRLHKGSGNTVLLEIIDSGKGIGIEKINTIWEKYYRYSETHQRPIKGTGLGLSIVKTILQNHKLKFGVISKKNIGSNFFIEFTEVEENG